MLYIMEGPKCYALNCHKFIYSELEKKITINGYEIHKSVFKKRYEKQRFANFGTSTLQTYAA